jgi:hypothetical protein
MIENLMQADFVLFLLFLLLCSLLCSLFWLFGCCYLDFVRIQPEVDFRLYFDTEDQSHDGIIYLITGKTTRRERDSAVPAATGRRDW